LAQAVGAKLTGDWKGCHSTAWDANAKADTGDRNLSNQYTKSGYPLGIMVNTLGNRFVDEGEDFRNYTYAKFGSAILHQPGGCAFQIFDNQVISWLRVEEYGEGIVKKFIANSIDKLADKLVTEGLEDKHQFCQTLSTFNNAVQLRQQELPLKWDPAVKDALSTQSSRSSLPLPKSNWALPITEPPFMAVKVTCGVTFTFGGLAIDPDTSAVLSEKTGKPIEGLFCAGEMVGGLFYTNYPGGSGLTAGAVYGRKAGLQSAKLTLGT